MSTCSVKITTGTSFASYLKELTTEVRKVCMRLSTWHRLEGESCMSHNENTSIMALTFMSHCDCVLFGAVIVDNDSRGIKSSCVKDLLLEGALPSLHNGHPVCGFRWDYEPGGTAALHIHC